MLYSSGRGKNAARGSSSTGELRSNLWRFLESTTGDEVRVVYGSALVPEVRVGMVDELGVAGDQGELKVRAAVCWIETDLSWDGPGQTGRMSATASAECRLGRGACGGRSKEEGSRPIPFGGNVGGGSGRAANYGIVGGGPITRGANRYLYLSTAT